MLSNVLFPVWAPLELFVIIRLVRRREGSDDAPEWEYDALLQHASDASPLDALEEDEPGGGKP